MKNIYDDADIKLQAKIDGSPKAVAKVKTAEFVITKVAQNGDETDLPPAEEKLSSGSTMFGLTVSRASTEHKHTPEKVPDGDDHYDLRYQVKIAPQGKTPIVKDGEETYRVWPGTSEITFVADQGDEYKEARFRVVQGRKTSGVKKAANAKWSERLKKSEYEIKMEAPFAFDGDVTHRGAKRTYKIKKNPYKFEFVRPKPDDPTVTIKQYVNLDPDGAWAPDKPFGHQIEFQVGVLGDRDRDKGSRMGKKNDIVHIEVNFTPATKRNDPKPALLSDGLTGSPSASNSNKTYKGQAKLDSDGLATFKVELGFAGGDTCEVKIGADDTCADATLTLETWRRLFYELMYCDVMAPDLKDVGGGKHDFPDAMKNAVDTRLGAVFIEYQCIAHHKYGLGSAPAGIVRPAAYVGRAGRQQLVLGGGLPRNDPVPFNAENDRTIHIKLADSTYSTNRANNPQSPIFDGNGKTWRSNKYTVPLQVSVGGCEWTAEIANPDAYKVDTSASFTETAMATDDTQPLAIIVTETNQGTSHTVKFARKPDKSVVETLTTPEKGSLETFFDGLLDDDTLKQQDNKLEFELGKPGDAGGCMALVQDALTEFTTAKKKTIYVHPGLKADGTPMSGPVDAAWFNEVNHDTLRLDLPHGTAPEPWVGPLSATKCPIKVEFMVKEGGKINGNSSGVRQLFCFAPPPKTKGAMASTLCHELGHSMGMTIMAGRSVEPPGMDPAKHVDNAGVYYLHGSAPFTSGIRNIGVGPHCANGVAVADRADPKFNNKSGSCIMFHAGGNDDSRPSYCATCVDYLKARKITDIRTRWSTRSQAES